MTLNNIPLIAIGLIFSSFPLSSGHLLRQSNLEQSTSSGRQSSLARRWLNSSAILEQKDLHS